MEKRETRKSNTTIQKIKMENFSSLLGKHI